MNVYYKNIFGSALSNWLAISSNINYSWGNSSNQSRDDEYYATTTSTAGLLGYTEPMKKILFINVDADVNENWDFCRVYIYTNQMDANNMTDAQKISNATHEIGHSLKLAHPTSSHTSVMNQGIQSIGPTDYDRSELISKWGN